MSETQTAEQDPGTNRLEDRLDAVLHLLDRQVVDCEGRMVGKVDDLELTEREDRTLHVTGILTGLAALVPRLGGDHDRGALGWWHRLSPARADRTVPGWIDIDDVDALGSGVELKEHREDLVRPQPPAGDDVTHRSVGDLLGMRLEDSEGRSTGLSVSDVRVEPEVVDTGIHPRVVSLLVGKVRPGTLLGYDRAQVNGPWPVAKVLAWVNRHTAELAWDDIARIDWDDRVVRASAPPQPLRNIDAH